MSLYDGGFFIHENPQEILKDTPMVIFFSAMLNEIYRLGRK